MYLDIGVHKIKTGILNHCTRDLTSLLPKTKLECTNVACLDDVVINCLLGLQLCICKAQGYKPRITQLWYFYILVRSKEYEIGGVRRTIDSRFSLSFILIQLGSNDLVIAKTLELINTIEVYIYKSEN